MILVLGLFLACTAVGAGLTYCSSIDLRTEERLAYGAVVGLIAYSVVALATAYLFGVSGRSVLAAVLVVTVLTLPTWRRYATTFAAEGRDFARRLRTPLRDPGNPWPLLGFLALAWPFTVRTLRLGYIPTEDGGLIAGNLSTWTDWQAHLAYAGSFAYADNVPPELPTAAGNDLGYHFGIDFLAGTLVPLGLSLPRALQMSSGVLAFALPAVMYLAVTRIFASRAVGLVSVVLFTMFGGLGWTRLIDPLRAEGPGIIWNLPFEFTRDHEAGYWIENSITGHLFPQRPTLFGFSATLIVFALLWTARQQREPRAFLFTGLLVGVLPIFHLFGFGTCLVLGAMWAVMERRREWILFLVPAIVLALPVVWWMLPPTRTFQFWEPYVSGPARDENIVWFWLRNMGPFIPLLLVAQFWRGVVPRAVLIASLPIWLWLIGPNIVQPHPSDINNTHYFVYFLLLGTPLVAALLVHLGRQFGGPGIALATIALLAMTLAGALDLFKIADPTTSTIPLASGGDLAVAEWARNNTADDAVFAIGLSQLEPIPALGGRKVMMGFPGWIFDLGIPDWFQRRSDTLAILQAQPGHEALIDQYGIDYVVIGPLERAPDHDANSAFWDSTAPVVYDLGGYRVYQVGPQ